MNGHGFPLFLAGAVDMALFYEGYLVLGVLLIIGAGLWSEVFA